MKLFKEILQQFLFLSDKHQLLNGIMIGILIWFTKFLIPNIVTN